MSSVGAGDESQRRGMAGAEQTAGIPGNGYPHEHALRAPQMGGSLSSSSCSPGLAASFLMAEVQKGVSEPT